MSKSSTARQNAGSQITVLPETDSHTLCVRLDGMLSLEDYQQNFYKPLQKIAAHGQPYGLLIHYGHGYKGWSKEAADLSFQSIIDYGKTARKIAYVNPPESKIFQVKMSRPLFGGEIRFFDGNDLPQALKWVKS
jgi:hypothetical protein